MEGKAQEISYGRLKTDTLFYTPPIESPSLCHLPLNEWVQCLVAQQNTAEVKPDQFLGSGLKTLIHFMTCLLKCSRLGRLDTSQKKSESPETSALVRIQSSHVKRRYQRKRSWSTAGCPAIQVQIPVLSVERSSFLFQIPQVPRGKEGKCKTWVCLSHVLTFELLQMKPRHNVKEASHRRCTLPKFLTHKIVS